MIPENRKHKSMRTILYLTLISFAIVTIIILRGGYGLSTRVLRHRKSILASFPRSKICMWVAIILFRHYQ